jgi:hypothetical protein
MLFMYTYLYNYICDLKDRPVNLPHCAFDGFLYEYVLGKFVGSTIIYCIAVKIKLSL